MSEEVSNLDPGNVCSFRLRLWISLLAAACFVLLIITQLHYETSHDMKGWVFRVKSFRLKLGFAEDSWNASTNNYVSISNTTEIFMPKKPTLNQTGSIHENFKEKEVDCKYPILDPFDKTILPYITHPKSFNCKQVQPFLSLLSSDGFVNLNATEVKIHNDSGLLSCSARSVDRSKGKNDDAISYGNPKELNVNRTNRITFPSTDTVEVKCLKNGSQIYYNLHNHPKMLNLTGFKDTSDTQLSVFLFALDSVSQSMFRRHLPKTYEFLTQEMGVRVYQGYTKVADNTYPNMMAMLTGKRAYTQQENMQNELPDMSKKQFDDWYIIWKKFQAKKYATSFVEDKPRWGLFHYLVPGFAKKPTDHYMRPFFLARDDSKVNSQSSDYCFGNEPRYQKQIDISLRLLRRYNGKRHFFYSFYTELTHDRESELEKADPLFYNFFESIHNDNLLNQTMMLVFSDHGHRFASIRQTLIGLLEERMPMFSVYFPPWFYKAHPSVDKSVKINQKRLSSPFDVHQTLLDVVNRNFSATQLKPGTRGLSQVYEIPANRTCTEAGIPHFYCVCSQSHPVSVGDPLVVEAASYLIQHVNKLLSKKNHLCEKLLLKTIKRAELFEVNQKVAHGIKSAETAKKFTSDNPKDVTMKSVRVSVQAYPSDAIFEATVQINVLTKSKKIDNDVSRINKYGNQSFCVKDPRLQRYCYCKVQQAR